jgi:hypothetical protein
LPTSGVASSPPPKGFQFQIQGVFGTQRLLLGGGVAHREAPVYVCENTESPEKDDPVGAQRIIIKTSKGVVVRNHYISHSKPKQSRGFTKLLYKLINEH